MKPDFKLFNAEGRIVVIGGIGKLFYQDGFPIPLSISFLAQKGVEVSVLHVADECMKNGWSPKTTYNKILADFEGYKAEVKIDEKALHTFCFSTYEEQRQMIFNYLFKNREEAKKWLTQIIKSQEIKEL